MLPTAEASLVRRDPDLPGLGLLLDESRLSEWISHLVGQDVIARRRYLRYKPGTSAVLHVDAGGHALLVSAQSPGGSVKHTKTSHRAGGAVIGVDRDLEVLVGTPAADRHLPALARLADASARQRLLKGVVGRRAKIDPGETPALLRYKPHRRWVGTLPTVDGRNALVRVHRPSGIRRAVASLSALERGAPRTPALWGVDKRHGILVASFLEGRPAGEMPSSALGSVGEALAALHLRRDDLPDSTTLDHGRIVHATAVHVGILLPELDCAARKLAGAITKELGDLQRMHRPVHGDFSLDQAIIGPDGDTGVIDLDTAGLGDPADDVGCCVAASACDVVLGRLTEAEHAERMRAVVDGYASAGGRPDTDRVALFTAAHLLRRTVEPFRLGLTPDWPNAARHLLDRADATMRRLDRTGA